MRLVVKNVFLIAPLHYTTVRGAVQCIGCRCIAASRSFNNSDNKFLTRRNLTFFNAISVFDDDLNQVLNLISASFLFFTFFDYFAMSSFSFAILKTAKKKSTYSCVVFVYYCMHFHLIHFIVILLSKIITTNCDLQCNPLTYIIYFYVHIYILERHSHRVIHVFLYPK